LSTGVPEHIFKISFKTIQISYIFPSEYGSFDLICFENFWLVKIIKYLDLSRDRQTDGGHFILACKIVGKEISNRKKT